MIEGRFYKKNRDQSVTCRLCAQGCVIKPERYGICRVRKNVGGRLYSLNYGKLVAVHLDPIEKKPLRRFHPGEMTLSIAAPGCNFKCANCQNWQISQAGRQLSSEYARIRTWSPLEVVAEAERLESKIISYTYTEPTVFGEFALDTMKLARGHGLLNVWVTNGFLSRALLNTVIPYLDAINIDLKGFSDKFYQKNGGARLGPVKYAIREMNKSSVHLEITTLIIPGSNDSEKELIALTKFIASLSKEIPWHVIGLIPEISYQMQDRKGATSSDLARACQIGRASGLNYVYGDET